MAELEKKTKRYPRDLTDEEWARIEPFLSGTAKSGRPARTDLREVLKRDKESSWTLTLGPWQGIHHGF
jgi:putative transposase